MKFTYKLQSIGWANVELIINNKVAYMEPSYLTEPIVDLVRAIERMLPECVDEDEVNTATIFRWDAEPTTYRWILNKYDNELHINITCFDDETESTGKEVMMDDRCSFDAFVSELVISLEKLLQRHGIVGYRHQWCAGEFPLSSFLQLKQYIETSKKFPITIHNPEEWDSRYKSDHAAELALIKGAFKNEEED